MRSLITIVLVCQLLFWWNQSFSPVLPNVLTFLPKQSFMRPIDVTPLSDVLNLLDTRIPSSADTEIWVVGATLRFNSPMIYAMIRERKYKWRTDVLYTWFGSNDLPTILERLNEREWIIAYESITERPYLFTSFAHDEPFYRHDQAVLDALQTQTDTFEVVERLESIESNNRIWVFRNMTYSER